MTLKPLRRTLTVRLFLLIASVQTIILLAVSYGVIRFQQSTLLGHMIDDAVRVSDLIARSTRYSMLLNRKEDVDNILESIGEEPGVTGIRIYNKEGEIVFGTDQEELHKFVDMNAEACVVCHTGLDEPPFQQEQMYRIIGDESTGRSLGLITPIRNEARCAGAGCHVAPPEKTILGVLDVKIPMAGMDSQLARSRTTLFWLSGIAVVLVGVVAGAFLWLFVRRPVKRLNEGMGMVASGHLDHRLPVNGNDELGQLAEKFNEMTADLQRARQEITAWSRTLEEKVHEKTADLERVHTQMLQVEKMASLGNLASSVAHELNNPLEGILTYAKLMNKRLAKSSLPQDLLTTYQEELTLIADEAARCGAIVKNLLIFARQRKLSISTVRFSDILNRSVMLIQHHAEINNVRIESHPAPDETLQCDPDRIQQVLVALMINAVEAMASTKGRPEGGVLTVESQRVIHANALEVRVADNGPGMTEAVSEHIFEPFFTTKTDSKGVGLGLAIAYGIVERHNGTISVESRPGKGTVFTIRLPLQQPDREGESQLATSDGARQ